MRVLGVLLPLLGLASAAQAGQPVSRADRDAIREVISAQITAFRHDDAAAAFGLAAPNVKTRFGDARHFMAMVQAAYPAVFSPRSVSFGTVTANASFVLQRVSLIGPDGDAALALYTMQHEPDKAWRIAGCALITGDDKEI